MDAVEPLELDDGRGKKEQRDKDETDRRRHRPRHLAMCRCFGVNALVLFEYLLRSTSEDDYDMCRHKMEVRK